MNWLRSILAAVVAVVLASVIALQYVSVAKLRFENGALRGQLEQLTQARPEADSATNSAASVYGLNENQLAELLKLRGEVTQLRGQTNAIAAARRENEALVASLKEKQASSGRKSSEQRPEKSPEDALPQDIHPKEMWGYRGYGSPDATVESMMWAAENGDMGNFIAGMSPEAQEKFLKDGEGKDFAKDVGQALQELKDFRVLDRQTVSDNEMVLTIYYSRVENNNLKGGSEKHHFLRINGQWQASDD